MTDNRETFDALYDLYQKGALDSDQVLQALDIDPEAVRGKMVRGGDIDALAAMDKYIASLES